MGGRQKRLTQARRKELTKAMTEALVAGQFRLGEGQSLDSVLDEIDDGIKNDRYPIDVDLPGLLAIWSGTPAPEAAQTAAGSEQGAPPAAETLKPGAQVDTTNATQPQVAYYQTTDGGLHTMPPESEHVAVGPAGVPGTVEHAQAQAAAANGASPTAQAILGTGPAIGTGNAVQNPQNGHQVWSSAQQKMVMVNPDGSLMDASTDGQANADAIAAMAPPAPVTEIGKPATEVAPKEEKAPVVDVDLDAIRGWLQIARGANEKIQKAKDVKDQALSQINDFLDQQGGTDTSKLGLLDGQPAVRRTFVRRKNLNTDALLADHPEISREQYTEKTPYYKSELL